MGMNFKRFLSLLLAFVMVLGMFPMGHVHAEENTEAYSIDVGATLTLTINGEAHETATSADPAFVNVESVVATQASKSLSEAITTVDGFDGTKQYIFVGARAGNEGQYKDLEHSVLTDETYTSAAANWLGEMTGLYMNGPASAESEELWKITKSGDGYTVEQNGKYLSIGLKSAAMSDNEGMVFEFGYTQDRGWRVKNGNNYLSEMAATTLQGAFGWNEANDDGNFWNIYEVVTTEASTVVTIKGVAAGTTTVTVGDHVYTVTVNAVHIHAWKDATCTAPKTCTTCGETEGKANGHTYTNDYDSTCNVCGEPREGVQEFDSEKLTITDWEASQHDTTEAAYKKLPEYAFDGKYCTAEDYTSFWATVEDGNIADQYLIAKLGEALLVNQIKITQRWYPSAGYNCTGKLLNYFIWVKTDADTDWTCVAEGNTVDGTTTVTFEYPVVATQIKLTSTSSQGNKVMNVAEFEIFKAVCKNGEHTPNEDDGDCTSAITCSICGTVTTPGAEEHAYNSCEDTKCANCNATREAQTHDYDEGKVTTEPTLEAEGEMTYTCSVCGGTKTESIAKLEPGLSVQPLMEGWTHGTVSLADCEYTITGGTYSTSVCHGGNYYLDNGKVNGNGKPQSNTPFQGLTRTVVNNKFKFMYNGSLFMYYNEGNPYWGKVSSVTGNETDGTGLFYVLKANPNGTFEGFPGYDVVTNKNDIKDDESYLIAANFGDEWFVMYPSTEAVSIAKVVNVAATHTHDQGKTTCSCGHAHIGGESQDTHELTYVEAKDPTCTEPGNIEYWHCSECDGYWKDEACTVSVSKDVVTISAYGHSYEASVTAPTCTEEGYTTYTCRRCNATETSNKVPAKGHGTIVHVEAKDATCTEAGNFEHWYCADCGAAWLDAERTQPTTAEETVISALGHSWDRNNEEWTAAYTCSFCEEATNPNYTTVVYFNNTETQWETVDAYFYGVNSGEFWAAFQGVENGNHTFLIHKDAETIVFMDGNSGAETITTRQFEVKNGKTYTANLVPIYFQANNAWDEITVTGYLDEDCMTPLSHSDGVLSEDGKYVLYVDQDAVKMIAAFYRGSEDLGGDVFDVVEGKTYFYPECNHAYDDGEVTKAPTCTETGIKTFTCNICGETKTESIPATHGPITHVKAKDATCTEAGNIEYWYCADCGAAWLDAERTKPTTAAETVIPALGHCWERENAGYCATHYYCCKCPATNPNYNTVVYFDNTKTKWETVKAVYWFGNEINGWAVSQGEKDGIHTFLIHDDAVSIDFRNGGSGAETIRTRRFEVVNNTAYDANLIVIYFQENIAWDKIMVTGATDESYDAILSHSSSKTPEDGKHVLYMDEDASVMMATFYLGDTLVYRCQFNVVEGKTYFYPECNHAYNNGEVTKAPTCTETGIKTFTCSICGETKTESIPATGNHTPAEPVKENETAAGYDLVTKCSVCSTELERKYVDLLADKVVMVSKNVELKAEIQMVYTVKIPAYLIDSGAYVVMAKTGAYGEVTKTYTNAELKAGENLVTMGVAPAEITSPISITVYDGNGVAQDLYNRSGEKLENASRTVAGYAVELLEDEDSTSELKDLAVALLTYGGYAQQFFGVDAENPAFNLLADLGYEAPDLSNITAETLAAYKNTQTNAKMGVKATTIATYVDSNIRIRVYLAVEGDIDDYTFTLETPNGDKVVKAGYDQASQRYYVDITEIASGYIDYEYKITISDGTDTNVITASVLAYARSALVKSTDEKLQNLAKALYLYNQAADNYWPDR